MSEALDLIGRTIAGRYEIVRLLGEGGMGAVYQARQVAMDRMVALKLIKPEVVQSREAVARFHAEMKVTARVEHPNTVRVYDFGEAEGRLYLAMEFIDGPSLHQAIEDAGRLAPARIARIAKQIANALGAAHARGIIHRDLKPDNVMLVESYGEPDYVKVLDFGVAKSLEAASHLTTAGSLVGTPLYMAPEQALARPIDARTDLYSLGVVLYQMTTGRVPFDAPTMPGVLMAHVTEPPPPIVSVVPDTPPGLADLVMQLLAKDPAARPASAAEVVARLEAAFGMSHSSPPVSGTSGRPSVPPRAMGGGAGVPPPERSALGFSATEPGTPRAALPPAGAPVPPAHGMGTTPVRSGRGRLGWIMAAAALAGGGVAALAIHFGGGSTAVGDAAVAVRSDAVLAASPDAARPMPVDTAPAASDARRRSDAALAEPDAVRPADAAPGDGAVRAVGDGGIVPESDGAVGVAGCSQLVESARAELVADAKRSLVSAEEAVRLCPSDVTTYHALGNALQKLGRLDEAEDAYVRGLGLAPGHDPSRFNLGVLQLRRKDASAAATFTELLRRNPDHPAAHLARSQAYLLAGRNSEALADLEEAVRRQPKNADAWAALGAVRQKLGFGDAKAAYCEAKRLGHPQARCD